MSFCEGRATIKDGGTLRTIRMPKEELPRGFGLSTSTYVVIASMVGTGILVSPRDPEALAKAVIRFLQDKEYALKLGKKLEEEVQPRFTLSRMAAQTQSLYLKLYEN